MKRILSLILSLTMLVFVLPAFIQSSTVQANAELPAAADLRQYIYLPHIGNQGSVGACASYAIGYTQYTNAFARYAYNNDIEWGEPYTGNVQYNFSPRFTYNLAGAGTAWVYEIIKEQGIPTQNYSSFTNGVTGAAPNDNRANDWAVQEGVWRTAQNYRIKDYDQVWLGTACNYQMTTSAAGVALIDRVKEHLSAGNVVVTGGYPSRWVTNLTTLTNGGTYGEVGEYAIPFSTNVSSGGHQVCIVGYDDNVTCVYNGVTLKGAFLVANSWGTSWQNDGYIWMMYDAMNQVSEYDALNVSNRTWTMDQLGFLDWRTDIEYGAPELMTELQLTVNNRDDFTVTLNRTDAETGETVSYTPYMFSRESVRPRQGVNFYGHTDTTANYTTGWLAFNYDNLIESIPAGKTVEDYVWSATVSADSTASDNCYGSGAVTVKTVRLYQNGTKIYEKTPTEHIAASSSTTFSLTDSCLITTDKAEGTVITSDLSALCASGEEYSFTVSAATGYTVTDALYVSANGRQLMPDASGVYSFTVTDDTVIKVTGIVHTHTSGTGFSTYGKGAEFQNNKQVFVMNIPKTLPTDVYSLTGNYRYTFRFTVNGSEVYDFTPISFYSNWLVRIHIAEQGWIPVPGNSYKIKVQVCEEGVPIYTATNTFTFNYASDADIVYDTSGAHTHSFSSGSYIYTDNGSCTVSGAGFEYCSHAGCTAIIARTDLPQRGTNHDWSEETVVLKNATHSTEGELGHICNSCGSQIVTAYFVAENGDCNGDRSVDVTDLSMLLDFYEHADSMSEEQIACSADLTGDGKLNIKDITHMLLILSGKIS